jgi:hypothetical protein
MYGYRVNRDLHREHPCPRAFNHKLVYHQRILTYAFAMITGHPVLYHELIWFGIAAPIFGCACALLAKRVGKDGSGFGFC